MQFHIECDTAMVESWVAEDVEQLTELGYDPAELIDECARVLPDLEEVWRPFAGRFAAIALGQLTLGRQLPVIR
jgi:hypothetical protein